MNMDFKLPNNPRVSVLYGSPAKVMVLIAVVIFLPSIFLSSFLKVVSIVLAVIVLLMALSNIYIRFKSKWARIHYPVSMMYTQSIIHIMRKFPDLPLNRRVYEAYKTILTKLYPSMSEKELEIAIEEINNDNILTSRENIHELFKYKGVKGDDLNELTNGIVKRYRLDQPETGDKLQISNFYAHIIGAKYGEKEVFEYIFAMINNKVK